MKRSFSLLGLFLLLLPLLRHLAFDERLVEARSAPELLAAVMGIGSGLTCGFLGLMILGFVCDGGRGYSNRVLFIAMAILGCAWCCLYPSGWILGVPLIVYAISRLFRLSHTSKTAQTSHQ